MDTAMTRDHSGDYEALRPQRWDRSTHRESRKQLKKGTEKLWSRLTRHGTENVSPVPLQTGRLVSLLLGDDGKRYLQELPRFLGKKSESLILGTEKGEPPGAWRADRPAEVRKPGWEARGHGTGTGAAGGVLRELSRPWENVTRPGRRT